MNIFVLNCGSSSLKYKLFEMPGEIILSSGKISTDDEGNSIGELNFGSKNKKISIEGYQITGIMEEILFEIVNPENSCIKSLTEIGIVGHRLIHGSEQVQVCSLIDSELLHFMEKSIPLAPLHYPSNIEGIKATIKFLPDALQTGVFDTAFHFTIPEKAFLYGLPRHFYEEFKIRRYGFHGTSHKYVSQIACDLADLSFSESKIISCHLGSGASLTAIKNGISVDTSMGFTPSEGLTMGTRCGDMDTGVVLHLQRNFNISIDEMDDLLNKKGGLLGLSGISSDYEKVSESANLGNRNAAVALDVFAYRIRKYIGAYTAVLGGLDVLIFTGGIGENSAELRQKVCEGFEFLGIRICEKKNAQCCGNELIHNSESRVKIAVVKTNEEIAIAREVFDFMNKK